MFWRQATKVPLFNTRSPQALNTMSLLRAHSLRTFLNLGKSQCWSQVQQSAIESVDASGMNSKSNEVVMARMAHGRRRRMLSQ
jgi:hypothetical protein